MDKKYDKILFAESTYESETIMQQRNYNPYKI